jgi:hypothetical protein
MSLRDSSGQPSASLAAGQCLASILGAHATIRQLTLRNLSKSETDTLRGVCLAMRAAVNQNVSTIDVPRKRRASKLSWRQFSQLRPHSTSPWVILAA